jgi:hypothetical protein
LLFGYSKDVEGAARGDAHSSDVLEIIDIFQGRTALASPVPFFEAAGNSTESTGAKIDPTVLIVDDSITVRELLSLSFNKAGYRVEQARDGQEAWEKLRSGLPYDSRIL